MLFYILCGLIGIIFLIFITGLFLPSERIISRKGHFEVSPEILYRIVTDNTDWQYRSDLKNLILIRSYGETEVWEEVTKNGSVIHFKTREKRPFSFYSFDMRSNIFTGYWTGEFDPDGKGGTIFTATEYLTISNPFIKILALLFFDPGKFMDVYQEDLQRKVKSMR